MKRNALIFAPHPDDEILGCGGIIAKMTKRGDNVSVVIVSDGCHGLQGDKTVEIRKKESVKGLGILGVVKYLFWDFPDNKIPLSGEIIERCRRLVEELRPNQIFLPSSAEYHLDHRRVSRMVIQALEGKWSGELYFYETLPNSFVNHIDDITDVFKEKREALKAHKSQLSQHNYLAQCESLAKLRGVAIGKKYGEGYMVFSWDGSRQNFFETFPLISVIVRACDNDLLVYALSSLVSQEYDHLEAILVWFGEGEPELEPFSYLDIHVVVGKTNRSHNLNIGVAAAKGDYISFLDEDDILYPHHFSTLLPEIHGLPDVDLVYSGTRLTSCEKDGKDVRVNDTIKIINMTVSSGRLLVGNTIPIHAVLYRSGIFHSHKFSEDLGAYEDWEFLARIYMTGFRFSQVNEVTCEYRLFDYAENSDTENVFLHLHKKRNYVKWREVVLSRIINLISVKHLEDLSSVIDERELHIGAQERKIESEKNKNSRLEKKLEELSGLEKLVKKGLALSGKKKTGRSGLASWIACLLPREKLFSIILPTFNTPPDLLSQTLLSVHNQIYEGWELCVVDDGSSNEKTLQLLDSAVSSEEFKGKIHIKKLNTNSGIVTASMEAIALGNAPYLVFIDHDDLLHEEALLHMAIALKEKPYKLLYSDSRKIDLTGKLLHVDCKQ
ncbi:MAG: glycosyltransferase, partial [Nitrospinae bacterium]|nr:glycosyltransferase [Nitrospinota bacterium]